MTVHTSDDRWLDAPVETVFAFMDEPANQAAVTPSLTRAERIEYEMSGDLSGHIAWRFKPERGGTRLTYAADYEVPGPLPEVLLAPLIRWYNRREVRQLLDNVAEAAEGNVQATAGTA